MSQLQLTGLYIYPIKSAGGIALSSAVVEERGLQLDRRWMVVNAAGKFMTQRHYPKMALMQVALEGDRLIIRGPNMPTLEIPTVPTAPDGTEGSMVEVWGDRCPAWAMGEESQHWLTQFLGVPCQLVYMPLESDRPIHHPDLASQPKQVSFADGYPFLLISEASLADLNQRLASPVPMNRFRPNLVVSGCPPFAEDTWHTIQIGKVSFRVAKPCSRCVLTTVDQSTGTKGKEPLATLATYRHWDGKIWFGQNLWQESFGTLYLNDSVTLLK